MLLGHNPCGGLLAIGLTDKLKETRLILGFFEVVKLVSTHFRQIDLTGLQSIFWVLA
jgi:hypothetical protein